MLKYAHRFADIHSSEEQREHLCINIEVCVALIVRVLLVFRAPEIITKLEKHDQRKVDCFTDRQNSLYVAVAQTVIVVLNETLQPYSPSRSFCLLFLLSSGEYLIWKEKRRTKRAKRHTRAYLRRKKEGGGRREEGGGRIRNDTIVFRDLVEPCTLQSKSFMARKGERVTRIGIGGRIVVFVLTKTCRSFSSLFVPLVLKIRYLTVAVTAASRSRRWKIYVLGYPRCRAFSLIRSLLTRGTFHWKSALLGTCFEPNSRFYEKNGSIAIGSPFELPVPSRIERVFYSVKCIVYFIRHSRET